MLKHERKQLQTTQHRTEKNEVYVIKFQSKF